MRNLGAVVSSPPKGSQPGAVGRVDRWSETVIAFARLYPCGIETVIAFAGEKRVFGAFSPHRGDAGFSGALLGVCSGVVGFNVATLSRLVREKVRPVWSDGGREREKVRPARSKHPKIGVFTLAGRTFSRKCRWSGGAGRTFSRKSRWRGRAGRVLSRQPVLRRSWMQRGALQAGCGGGFAALEALPRRVGVPMMQFPPVG